MWTRNASLLAVVCGVVILVLPCAAARADGVVVLRTIVSDNGDGDGFADTNETVQLSFELRNDTGSDLVGAHAILTTKTPDLVCLTTSQVDLGDFTDGEIKLSPPFDFHVLDVDRAAMGLDAFDFLSASFELKILTDGMSFPAMVTPTFAVDLDIDVSGGAGSTTFFESFESETLGAFENDNIDEGLYGLEASDGYRCQYSDPDWVNSNSYSWAHADECHLGVSAAHADATFWGISGPAASLGGRAYTGTNSLYFGVDLGPPENWTTPLAVLEAVRSSQPIHLDWSGDPPLLSIKHQVSLLDDRWQPGPGSGTSTDRGVVLAQFADDQGNAVGPWLKLYPHQNVYDHQNYENYFNCTFDPTDDGNSEDDFFDPEYPHRRAGPSSTCWPEFIFSNIGETSSGFDPDNLGSADGPGLAGESGIGTWIESLFDLDRFRGRSVRLRFLATSIVISGDYETWEESEGFNPDPVDDGWWIDDVTVTQTLVTPASVAIDVTDNSGLPGPPETDGDSDGVFDVCDNCPTAGNADQQDQDRDGLGDECDPCPRVHLLLLNHDVDGDQICTYDNCPDFYTQSRRCSFDNCPEVYNPDQADGDRDFSGSACDCDDDDPLVYSGGEERNDGLDNDCPGDPGYGQIDELTGMIGFYNYLNNPDLLSWPQQIGASQYEVASASKADFSLGCATHWIQQYQRHFLTAGVLPGKVRFYLVRPILPNVGSWGAASGGTERSIPCAP